MIIKTKELNFQTNGGKITYFKITDDVINFVKEMRIKNGIVTVQSEHTTCSVFFEEMVHDVDVKGDDFLQVDLNNGLEKIFPNQNTDGMYYKYPGPKHLEHASSNKAFIENPLISLNGPAHLKSSLIGASQTFVINENEVKIGRCGDIYFVDFDYCRPRARKVHICVIGEEK